MSFQMAKEEIARVTGIPDAEGSTLWYMQDP